MARSYPAKFGTVSLLTENSLSNIIIEGGNLSPSFSKETLVYNCYINQDVDYINLQVIPDVDLGATISIENKTVLPYSTTVLKADTEDSIINIEVISEANTTKTYLITKVIGTELTDNRLISNVTTLDNIVSCAGWVYIDSSGVDRYVATKYQVFSLDAIRAFANYPRVTLYFADTTNVVLPCNGFAPTLNTWNHYAFTYDGNTGILNIYMNGSLIATHTYADKVGVQLKQFVDPFYVGSKHYETSFASTRDVRIYDYVLTNVQILELFNLRLLDFNINTISQISALPGGSITITGENFLKTITAHIGDVLAVVNWISPYSLTIAIPESSTAELYLTQEAVNYTVVNPFTVLIPPKIPEILTFTWASYIGSNITLTGVNFSDNYNESLVKIGDVQVSVVSGDSHNLVVTIGSNVKDGIISVTCKGQTGYSKSSFYVALPSTTLTNLIDNANNGDTIQIPEGNYLFTTGYNCTKKVSLNGAGIGKTRILSSIMGETLQPLRMVLDNAVPYSISNITFMGITNTGNKSNTLGIYGTPKRLRIHHCESIRGGSHFIMLDGDIQGLIDHCTFTDAALEVISIRNSSQQNNIWTNRPVLGTDKAIFIEDCTFTMINKGELAITSVNGQCYVFRHNTIFSARARNAAPVDTHGNYYNDRSGYSSEIYENTFVSENSFYGIYMRGGSGVIWNNTLSGLYYQPICLGNDGSFLPRTGPPYHDDNYPAIDQINHFYIWNNTYNNVPITDGTPKLYVQNRGKEREHIQINRDYFTSIPDGIIQAYNPESIDPEYVPYAYPHPLTTT